jgi:hypothetical protein
MYLSHSSEIASHHVFSSSLGLELLDSSNHFGTIVYWDMIHLLWQVYWGTCGYATLPVEQSYMSDSTASVV